VPLHDAVEGDNNKDGGTKQGTGHSIIYLYLLPRMQGRSALGYWV
jgi:hypothetical protein